VGCGHALLSVGVGSDVSQGLGVGRVQVQVL
jgi:hypothetical protein